MALGELDKEKLSAFLDGELPSEEMAEVQRRLDSDPGWQAEYQALVRLGTLFQSLEEPSTGSVVSKVDALLDKEFPQKRSRWRLWFMAGSPSRFPLYAGAAAMVAVLVGMVAYLNRGIETTPADLQAKGPKALESIIKRQAEQKAAPEAPAAAGQSDSATPDPSVILEKIFKQSRQGGQPGAKPAAPFSVPTPSEEGNNALLALLGQIKDEQKVEAPAVTSLDLTAHLLDVQPVRGRRMEAAKAKKEEPSAESSVAGGASRAPQASMDEAAGEEAEMADEADGDATVRDRRLVLSGFERSNNGAISNFIYPKALGSLPELPIAELNSGKYGEVMINFTITKEGTVKEVRLAKGSDAEPVKNLVKAIEGLTFRPGKADHVPVEFQVSLTLPDQKVQELSR